MPKGKTTEADELAALFADVEPSETVTQGGVVVTDPGDVGVDAGDEPALTGVVAAGNGAAPLDKNGKPLRGIALKKWQEKQAAGGNGKLELCEWCRVGHKPGETHVRPLPEGKTLEQAIADQRAQVAAANGAQATGSLYEQRQKEIADAKARPGGRKSGKKSKKQEAKENRDKLEAERKAKLAKDKEEKARVRASKAMPTIIARAPKWIQDAFGVDYALAGPKTDRNPEGLGARRAKADRGDFAAGYVMGLRRQADRAKAGAS